jgi:MFS family permease
MATIYSSSDKRLTEFRSRGVCFAIMGVVWGVAGCAGPVFGGALTHLLTWRWCFYTNRQLCRAILECAGRY